MVEDRFFDGVGNVAVQGAVARVELMRLVDVTTGDAKPTQQVDMRLVMPIEGLLRMYQTLGQIVGQMEDKGVVRKRASPEENVLEQ